MAIDYSRLAHPKGITRRVVKAKQARTATAVAQQVRAQVAERDGSCRLRHADVGVCGGASEWAHLEETKRARTRGMPAAVRHTTEGTVMLCTLHHQRYDAGEIEISYLTTGGADGRLVVQCRTTNRMYIEAGKGAKP